MHGLAYNGVMVFGSACYLRLFLVHRITSRYCFLPAPSRGSEAPAVPVPSIAFCDLLYISISSAHSCESAIPAAALSGIHNIF